MHSAPLHTCPPGNTTPHHAQAWFLWVKPKLEAKVWSVRWAARLLLPPTLVYRSQSPSFHIHHFPWWGLHTIVSKSLMETPVAPAMLSDLVLDPGLRLALLVTYAYMAVLQSTRIRLPVATITSSSCSLIKLLVSTLALPKTQAGLSSACNLNITHHIQPFGCIMVHIISTNGNAKMNNMVWVDGPMNSVCIKNSNASVQNTTAIQKDLNLTDLTGLPNPLRRADTLKAIFQVDTCSALCTRAGGTFIHVCNINTKSCFVLQIWKTHLKLCFKITCWETVCIKKSYYTSYILWDVFSFMHINIQTGQFYTQHVCAGYSPPTTHTNTLQIHILEKESDTLIKNYTK